MIIPEINLNYEPSSTKIKHSFHLRPNTCLLVSQTKHPDLSLSKSTLPTLPNFKSVCFLYVMYISYFFYIWLM